MTADTVVAHFEISLRRFLDDGGRPVAELPAFTRDRDLMQRIYRAMSFTRLYDAKRVSLQRTGRMGTSATALGQEAVPIGYASAMRADDVLVPAYREDGAQIWRGVAIHEMLIYWGGNEAGQCYADPRVAQDFPVAITVGNQVLHAAGVATAMKLRGEPRAALSVIGDGATSKGDFYEALNVAGVWQLPVVFVITNNRWAISTPLERQTAAGTLAQKGLAGGIAVLQADGNDVIAVHDAVSEALARARSGKGATVIECLTYRLNDHNTADDSTRYRDPEEVKARWAQCPLKRLRTWLEAQDWWSDAQEETMRLEIARELDQAVEHYLSAPSPEIAAMFDYTYARLPRALEAQRAEALRLSVHG